MSHGHFLGAAGSVSTVVTFHNTSTTTCTLTGYPGMQLLGAGGATLTTTVHRGASATVPSIPERTVSVPAGGAASFVAGWADATGYGNLTCPRSTEVEITAPNDYTSKTVAWAIAPYGGNIQHLQCGLINVSPVFSGVTPPGQ